MNALSSLSRFSLLPLALACCLPLASCHSTKSSTDGQYASYNGNDGHYNPYPAGSKPNYKYQQYNESPPPPAYNGGSDEDDTPKKKKGKTTTHSSSGTSKSKSGTKSGTKSGSKSGTPKSSSSKGKSKSKSKSSSGSGSGSGSTHKSSGSSSGSYTVKSNDTLYGIAKKHHTTVSKIKNLNGLSSDTIHGGQKLKLP